MKAKWATFTDRKNYFVVACVWIIFKECIFPGEGVYSEESLVFCHICGDSNPLPLPFSCRSLGPTKQMVGNSVDITENYLLYYFKCFPCLSLTGLK